MSSRLLLSIIVACLASPTAHAVSALNVGKVEIATDAGLFIGSNCSSSAFHLDAVFSDGNGGTLHCGAWRLAIAPPPVPGGFLLPNLYADNVPIFGACRFLALSFSGATGQFSTLEIDCRDLSADANDVLFANGWEATA